MIRLRFPLFFAAFILLWSCVSAPPARQDAPAEEKNESGMAAENPPEKEKPAETPDEAPGIVVRAEELIEALDKDPDFDLAEPVYKLNEPEITGVPEQAPPATDGPGAAIVLDEPAERPPEAESATSEYVTEDGAGDGPDADAAAPEAETEEAPPPAPEAALLPSETPADSPPRVSVKAPDSLPALPARNPPEETERHVTPALSRTIEAKTREIFEIPFAETGWVYTGENNSKNGISYDSRRMYGDSQVFVFRAEKEGDYTLKFYRQDFLRDYVTNEYVRVIVKDETLRSAVAPLSATVGGAEMPARPQPEEIPPTPENLLQQAREAVAAQKYPDAIALLERMEAQAALNDEAWWLYGQAFEADSPSRDIRSALDAYSCIVRDYPQSSYYKNARNRIAFLNKFYFNIR
ncbi:MAG: hypothetical protein LBD86_06275 [Spirochaetaceae bacterium]|nr:hypothetical protein [Spirochaetaceae bacterium]